jgi:hypothetical protein
MPSAQTLYRAAMLPSNDLGNVTAETQFSNGRGALLQLALPSNNSLANKSFRVRMSGRVATTTNTTFNLKVYFGISSTIASNTLILDCAAQTVNNVTSSFSVWCDCFWSADANAITGSGQGEMANNIVGQAVLNNTPLAANPNRDSSTFLASGGTYGFTLTGIFGGSSAGNHCIVDSFDLESV